MSGHDGPDDGAVADGAAAAAAAEGDAVAADEKQLSLYSRAYHFTFKGYRNVFDIENKMKDVFGTAFRRATHRSAVHEVRPRPRRFSL